MTLIKKRIHLEDKGQDLIFVEVELSDSIGIITSVPECVAIKDAYIGKAFDLRDNEIGSYFNYADPKKGFRISTLNRKVERIEDI